MLDGAPKSCTIQPPNCEVPAKDFPRNLFDGCSNNLIVVRDNGSEPANLLWPTDTGLQRIENIFETVVDIVKLKHRGGHNELNFDRQPVAFRVDDASSAHGFGRRSVDLDSPGVPWRLVRRQRNFEYLRQVVHLFGAV